ncbi:hypothetical protein DMH01_12575 [Amycolatopsis sp. WAC 04182]|nr:hypothetical protein DMH01_12575 [Amycolatopsis sp. WAC 04182]
MAPAPVAEVFTRLADTLRARPYNPGSEIDTERHFLAQQGGWWYRGEYDVATWSRWAVPLANRFFVGFAERVRDGFDRMLGDLAPPGGERRTLG